MHLQLHVWLRPQRHELLSHHLAVRHQRGSRQQHQARASSTSGQGHERSQPVPRHNASPGRVGRSSVLFACAAPSRSMHALHTHDFSTIANGHAREQVRFTQPRECITDQIDGIRMAGPQQMLRRGSTANRCRIYMPPIEHRATGSYGRVS